MMADKAAVPVLRDAMAGQGFPEYGLILVLFAIGIFGVLHVVL
jgi:hypothetical protein